MSYKQTLSKKPFESFGLQPASAWLAILGFVFISVLCLVAGGGGAKVLRFAFPLGSFAVGAFLYFRYPILYISFNWWIWFLTPMVARIADLNGGWDPQRLMLVSPFLATLVTFYTLIRHLPRAYHQGGLPFILPLIAVVYAFLIGFILNTPIAAARACLDWITPLLFAFHLFINWKDYPQLSQNIQRTFFWCVLVTGIYGVVQYLVAPAWDCYWITETELATNGIPEPLGIRVFSTMHSPLPFGISMMAGLLLLFNSQEGLRIPAAAAGYLSFLLSAVRTAWGGWVVGFIALSTSLKPRFQMRLIISILAIAICVTPLTTIEPFASAINTRLQTFSSIQSDNSTVDRVDTYNKNLALAFSEGLGKGFGGTMAVQDDGKISAVIFDSGILDLFFTLGWFGGIPYLGGILLLLFTLFQNFQEQLDRFATASRAISLGVLAQIALGSVMLSLSGMVLWSFLAMYMAARKYYQHQRAALKKGLI